VQIATTVDSTLLDCVPFAVIGLDLGGTISHWNHQAEETFRLTREQAVGSPFRNVLIGASDRTAADTFWLRLQAGAVCQERIDLHTKHGTPFMARVHGAVRRDAAGEPAGYVCTFVDVSDRDTAESQLRECRHQLAKTERTGQVGSWECDLESNRLTVSSELCRIYSRKPAALADMTRLTDCVHPGDRAQVCRALGAAVRGSGQMHVAHRIVPPGDDPRGVRHVETTLESTFDHSDEAIRLHGIVHDVTDRRRVVRVLRQYRSIVERAHQGFGISDPDGIVTFANARMAELLACDSPTDLVGRSGFDFVHPEWQQEAHRSLQRNREGLSERQEAHLLDSDGADIFAIIESHPWTDDDGEFAGSVTMVTDITDRKRADQRAGQLAAIVTSSEDAIVSCDNAGVLMTWNAGAERLYGYPALEAIGRKVDLIAPPDLVADQRRILELVLSGRTVAHFETQRRTRDGRLVDVSLTVSPVRDSEGRVVGASTIARDITERLRGARAYQAALDRLSRYERFDTLGQVAGGIAHDFNNALAVIITSAAVLGARVDQENKHLVDEIRLAAEQAAGVTRQLLTVGAHAATQVEVIDLNATILDLNALLRRSVGDRVEIELSLDPETYPIRAVRSQIEQVVINLVSNAADAMSGAGRMRIATFNATSRRAGLRVSDTGCGMTEEVSARAVEPFFTTKPEGTGIGLAIVHGIVRSAGGRLTIESPPGNGATVTIELPSRREDPAPRRQDRGGKYERGEGRTIVLVENDDSVRRVIERTLTEHGYAVVSVPDGPSALEAVDGSGELDVVLTDVVMPVMSGVQLATKLAEMRPALPVVFMSAYPDGVVAREGTLRPDAGFVRKPFVPETLLSEISRTLRSTAPS
jgi:two-component system cell cycle sensor histidine kinase/response regulator CckA